MSRESKFFKFQDGLDLTVEKDFLGLSNIKAYIILKELSTATGNLDNKTIAKAVGMGMTAYKSWKNHLVMCGLLQIRQLNASTYVYVLGEDAIEIDDDMHEEDDYQKLIELTYESLGLIDSSEYDDKPLKQEVSISVEMRAKINEIDAANPMPTTEDIISSFGSEKEGK